MRFKDYIKEAGIDIPRRTYAKGVFDEADTDNPKLKDKFRTITKYKIKNIDKLPPTKLENAYFQLLNLEN